MKKSVQSALIIGYGSIGKRHAQNLRSLGVRNISVFDPFFKGADESVTIIHQLPSQEDFDVCLICTPNDQHLSSFRAAYSSAKSFFIEKPVSIRKEDRAVFLSFMGEDPKPVMVGCNYRFDPVLQGFKKMLTDQKLGKVLFFKSEFGHHLPSWRPNQDYRKNYAAKKETGGGVLLDRIHEVDYLTWLFGGMLCKSAQVRRVSDLEIETEDLAIVSLKTWDGVPGTLHLDYLQPTYLCQLKAVGALGTLEWGFKPSYLKHTDLAGRVVFLHATSETDVNAMYLSQLDYFLRSIREGTPPMNGLEEAFETLELIAHIKEKSNA
jgi:predicted dehydrogenase